MKVAIVAVVAAFLQLAACTYPLNYKKCPDACAELKKSLGSASVTSRPASDAYWASQIQELPGACYVYPSTPEEVSKVVKTTVKYQCPFAIQGGGHSDVVGASNIAKGLVLSLSKFKQVKLSSDKTSAAVGGGAIWGDVYTNLDQFNYTVIGGRETTVGVGGLTLGGGISYFSGTYGFACDNVLSYEVVLGNGRITTASSTKNPDLYKALRGGGNNFAIVTTYHLAAFKYDKLQGGFQIYSDAPGNQKRFVDGFKYFSDTAPQSPDANMYISLSYSAGTPVWVGGFSYSEPSPPIPAVPAYKQFYTTELNATRIVNSQRVDSHSSFAAELGTTQPSGKREQFHTATFEVDPQLISDIYDVYRQVVARLYAALVGSTEVFTPSLAFLAITKNILEAQYQRGGNVLGLDSREAPLMIMSMSWPWSDPKFDNLFIGGMAEVVERANKLATKRKLTNPFIYMNYAQTNSPVVASYGAENVKFMKKVSAKYDPKGVFQKLVPGGFKLP